jgi:hypothetical protein
MPWTLRVAAFPPRDAAARRPSDAGWRQTVATVAALFTQWPTGSEERRVPHSYRPIPVGHADAAWLFRLSGDPEPVVCTMSFDFPTTPAVADANSLFNAWVTSLIPRMTSSWNLEKVHILYQSDSLDQIVVDSTAPTSPGGMSGGAAIVPVNCAWLYRKRTGLAGRRNRGRMYKPSLLETDVDPTGLITPAVVATEQGAANAFFTAISGFSPELIHSCVCDVGEAGHSGPHSCVPRPPTPVTALEVDDRLATQRRRMNR